MLSNLKNSVQRNSVTSYAAKVIKRICRSAIQRAKANPPAPNGKGSSLLSIAFASGGFTDDDVVNQRMAFLIAGHETNASALSWCIVMLCKHPEMQAKLRDELRSGLPNPRTTFHSVNANEFDTLPYLNAICNETLRLFLPAPLTIRVAAKDTTLLDHVIPREPLFSFSSVNGPLVFGSFLDWSIDELFIDDSLGLCRLFDGSDDECVVHSALRVANLFDFGGDEFSRVDGALFAAGLFDLRAYEGLVDGCLSFRFISASPRSSSFSCLCISTKRKANHPKTRNQKSY